jgi:hypothetical protein
MTAGRAVVIGHLRVTLIVLAMIVAGGLIGRANGARNAGLLVGCGLAWVWWSWQVPRWRDWVVDRGAPIDEVQRLAVTTALLWPKGSFMERTELRRRDGTRGW